MHKPSFRTQVTIVGLLLLGFMSAIAWFILPADKSAEFPMSFLIICVGVALGGFAGALASPGPYEEKETFKTVAGIASAFLTGAIWASFSDRIKLYFTQEVWSNNISLGRFLLFILALVLGGFVMYVFRAYGRSEEEKRKRESLKKIEELLKSL